MKKQLLLKFSPMLFLVVLLFADCSKDLPRYADYQDYQFSTIDGHGGSWKAILIESPTEIQIPSPLDPKSSEYLLEVADLKEQSSNLDQKKKDAIKYWTNNPVLRWNEIALDMAAKYNLIPPPNPDGTYTLPSPANPNGPPPFPFAHPPYTSRMLSYLSVAMFDGLITAWHYKYEFSATAGYEYDPSIEPAYILNNIPSYPADAAVVAAVSKRILTAMFPLEAAHLEELENQHLSSLKWSGMQLQSEIEAGKVIGTTIANIALERASTDGMSRAQAPKPVSDSIKLAAQQRFGWAWDNMESPVRPVGLVPLFGKVKMWNVPQVELVRSPIPPAPGSPEFEKDALELRTIAKNLTTEQRRIANWWEDGLGSYTPPGHWNKLAKQFCIKYQLNPLRSARVFAYMNMAIFDAGIACWDTKYYYHYPRPIQTINGFKTILGTPNFPAYTSGHSTFSAAAAEVLAYIFESEASYCRNWAEEAAVSRIYGGIHYRFDAEAGLDQGRQVAQYSIAKAAIDGAD